MLNATNELMRKFKIEVTYKSKIDGYVHKVKFYDKEHMNKYINKDFFEILEIKDLE